MTLNDVVAAIAKLPDTEKNRPAVAQTPDGVLHPVLDVKEVKADVRLNTIAIILTSDP